ncbi:MAG TPA: PAS domain-containing protein, partial [Croceibacterium sp.]
GRPVAVFMVGATRAMRGRRDGTSRATGGGLRFIDRNARGAVPRRVLLARRRAAWYARPVDPQQRTSPAVVDLGQLGESIELTPIATVVTDPRQPDNPIVAVNTAFERLTGYAREEILGRNCRFLAGPGTSGEARAALRAAQTAPRAAIVEVLNYRKDGSAFRNAVMIAPILDAAQRPRFFVGSQMDLGDAASPGDRHAAARARVDALTPRQRQVIEHLVAGLRNKQIGALLGIDEKTVKMHRAALLARLGCATSADAIRVGVEAGLGAADQAAARG